MNTWVKVENEYFDVNFINTQLSIGSHANLTISVNAIKNPTSYQFFTNWFDFASSSTANKYKKDISCKSFDSKGCFIKAIDFDPNTDTINLDISCDYLQTADVSERREEKLDELLNETSKNKLI